MNSKDNSELIAKETLSELSLEQLAEKINEGHERVTQSVRRALLDAWQTGQYLLQARTKVPSGTFTDWLEANINVSRNQAYKYIKLAGNYSEVGQLQFDSISQALLAITYKSEESRVEEPAAKEPKIEKPSVEGLSDLEQHAAWINYHHEKLVQSQKKMLRAHCETGLCFLHIWEEFGLEEVTEVMAQYDMSGMDELMLWIELGRIYRQSGINDPEAYAKIQVIFNEMNGDLLERVRKAAKKAALARAQTRAS